MLSSKPLKIEVSFEDAGTMSGVTTTGLGTYASEGHQDVSIYGEDQGAMITADGDRTPSQKLVRANIACGDEVDPAGNMTAKLREWK